MSCLSAVNLRRNPLVSGPTIYATLQAQIEELEDEWRATQDGLGLFAYGKTAEEASTRLMIAVDLLMDTLLKHGGAGALKARLDRAGIVFSVSEKPENVHRTLPLMLSVAKALNPA